MTKHTVSRYLKAAGVEARPGGQRRKLLPDPRECKCGCGKVFVPSRVQIARGDGEFFSHTCSQRFQWDNRYDPKIGLERFVRKTNWSGKSKQRFLGHVSGHKGASAGAAGGRPRSWGPDQAQQQQLILQLHQQGASVRAIAVEVFGDERFKNRVARFLNS